MVRIKLKAKKYRHFFLDFICISYINVKYRYNVRLFCPHTSSYNFIRYIIATLLRAYHPYCDYATDMTKRPISKKVKMALSGKRKKQLFLIGAISNFDNTYLIKDWYQSCNKLCQKGLTQDKPFLLFPNSTIFTFFLDRPFRHIYTVGNGFPLCFPR